MPRFHESRTGHRLPSTVCGFGGSWSLTAMSRTIALHSAGALSRASLACQVPGDGEATSAIQKYGGPSWRSRDFAATVPLGAISDSSPWSGFSAENRTRNAAPFHGPIGDGSTATSAASAQAPA